MRPYDPDSSAQNDQATSSGLDSAPQNLDYTYNPSLSMADAGGADAGTDALASHDQATLTNNVGKLAPEPAVITYRVTTTGAEDVEPADTADGQSGMVAPANKAGDTSNPDDTADETEAIRANIEQTRSHMSATIDAIQERLNPHNIVDQAKDAVREATIGRVENVVNDVRQTAQEAGNGFLDTVKENPIPAALAAVGLGWLFMKSRNKTNSYRYDYRQPAGEDRRYGYGGGGYAGYDRYAPAGGYDRYGYGPTGAGNGGSGGPGEILDRTKEKVGDVAGQVGSTVGDAAGQVRDTVGNVAGTVTDAAGSVVGGIQEKASNIGPAVQYGAQRAQNQLQRMLYENPIAVGAGALVIGTAIGMMLPETEPEHRLMGEAKANVVDKAQSAAQDALDKVSQVAQQAGNTVQEEARKQGITS